MKGGLLTVALLGFVAHAAAAELRGLDGRIVGGEATTVDKHPHQISLVYFSSHRCGGSIISEYYVITAAHCINTLTTALMAYLQIRVGSSYRNTGGTLHSVSSMTYHNQFDSEIYDYDIAVIKVKEPIEFSSLVQPIQLASTGYEVPDGTVVTVTGFGRLTYGGALPTQLQAVEVPMINNTYCVQLYADFNPVTETQICAGYDEGGRDACQGDSGGPLVHNHYLIGLVSWGDECAVAFRPGVYAKVAYFRDWLKEATGVDFE